MIAFIDDHRALYGVEPICKVLPIAPSTYHAHAARRADPGRLPARAKRDAALMVEIRRVYEANFRVYGVRKVWRLSPREGDRVARCRVARLMRTMGLAGVVRGRRVRTTVPDPAAACPRLDGSSAVQGRMPEPAMGGGFHYIATWGGFVYAAFVIDVFARRIVGWRVSSRSARADFVLDALEQALHERRPFAGSGLVCHSDRGSQYVSIRYTERPAEAGVEPSVGSVGDSYDNALAETVIGCSRRRSSIDAGRGARSRRSSLPRSNGWIGLITVGCSNRSATSSRRGGGTLYAQAEVQALAA